MRYVTPEALNRIKNGVKAGGRFTAYGLFCTALLTSGSTAAAAQANLAAAPAPGLRTWLPQSTLYPRLVRLSHGPAASNGRVLAATNGLLFASDDNGATFTPLSTVPVQSGSKERCCATLYEMPRTVGSLPAGTLLSSGSYYSEGVPAIEIHTSADQGHTWAYNSTPVRQGAEKHGLWEPEFTVANDGALVIFWSDETDPCCSQKLVQMRTYDGIKWQDRTDTVVSPVYAGRPGMAVVSRLPNKHFFMTYEVCGTLACTVYSRTSADGWNFGDPADGGTKVQTASGQYLEHAPANVLASDGVLLVVGQVLYESGGAVSPLNGQVLFINRTADGSGPWSILSAPVAVPTAYDNYCPNYSSALLPSLDGNTVLELASDYDSTHKCTTYYAIGKVELSECPHQH